MYIFANPNPKKKLVGDCVIRAIAISQNRSWEEIFDELTSIAKDMYDMPSSNEVWGRYLLNLGYKKKICKDDYNLKEFSYYHPYGNFIIGTGTHVICVIDGNYYDTWDSGDEIPLYYFYY